MRAASLADADRLALIGSATFLETFAGVLDGDAIAAHCEREHNASTYRNRLEAGVDAWLVEAASGRAPIGYLLLGRPDLPGSTGDGDIEIKRIYTLSRFHGSGIGAALMQCAVEEARQRACRRILLGVYRGNERALAFYAKNGFREVADRRFRIGDREYDDAVLAKDVDRNP